MLDLILSLNTWLLSIVCSILLRTLDARCLLFWVSSFKHFYVKHCFLKMKKNLHCDNSKSHFDAKVRHDLENFLNISALTSTVANTDDPLVIIMHFVAKLLLL